MPAILPRKFYLDSPEVVARNLLGKLIVRRLGRKRLSGRITEIEAYPGAGDPASHTFAGETPRNAVLFGPPGVAYVYFIYGMHYCLNFSCRPDGVPGGVLIRSLEPVAGLETMAHLRGFAEVPKPALLTSGPGRLCEALDITRANTNGLNVTRRESPLQVVDDGFRPPTILTTPRIGIRKAADRPLRFLMG